MSSSNSTQPPPVVPSSGDGETKMGRIDSIGSSDEIEHMMALGEIDDHMGQHSALRTMCVMDCHNETRIVPNGYPAIISNECFEGKVMLMVRTPDVDDPTDPDLHHMNEISKQISDSFKGKKRRFEFQFQVKLKRIPTGPLFLGCELDRPIKVGAITKGLVNILLAMVRRINPGFHYSWGPDPHKLSNTAMENGDYEKTHLSFPVEASMDRIVITKPGEPIPTLGGELYESNESVKRRRKMGSGSVDWNLDDTYTLCLWSAYCDWIQWKSMNVPGMSPFSLCRVTGEQPINLCVYEIDNVSPNEYRKKRPPHIRKHLHTYTRYEFSNDFATTGGIAGRVLGRGKPSQGGGITRSSHGDTDSIDSDFETASRASHITMG